MNRHQIVATLDAEIARLQQVRAVLNGTVTGERRGRPPASAKQNTPKKRVLSAEARAKIAEAQRRRWAKSKRAAKKATPKKNTTISVTKVAAKKAPVKRQPKPVTKKKTALSGSVPDGPIAAAPPAQ